MKDLILIGSYRSIEPLPGLSLRTPQPRHLQPGYSAGGAYETVAGVMTRRNSQRLTNWSALLSMAGFASIHKVVYRWATRFSSYSGRMAFAVWFGLQRKLSVPCFILLPSKKFDSLCDPGLTIRGDLHPCG